MDTDKANALVVTAVGVSAALVLIRDVHDNKMPPARFVIGSTVAAVGLATLAQFAAPLAGGIAALMLTTSVLVYGGPAWTILAARTAPPKSGTTTGTAPA
jgi:hypothetical protein